MHKLDIILSKSGQKASKGLNGQSVLSDAFINGENSLTELDRKKLKAIQEQFEDIKGALSVNHYIRSPQDVADLMMEKMRHLNQEHFVVLFLSTKYKVLYEETLFKGTVDSTLVSPKEIFNRALLTSCTAIVCVHNHPSGDTLTIV